MLNETMLNTITQALAIARENAEFDDDKDFEANLTYADNFIKALKDGDTIASLWSLEDVFSLMFPEEDGTRGHTDEEIAKARRVLKAAEDNHDATIGINWDTLQYHLDEDEG